HALEHDPTWSRKLSITAAKHGVDNIRLHITDLVDGFYDERELPDAPFAMALLDGPPRWCGDRSKAYQRLASRIEGASLLVDDVNDAHERVPLEAYAETHG